MIGSVISSVVLAAGICTVSTGTASAADPLADTFTFTGAAQTWTVPDGITSIQVVADGASGGDASTGGQTGGLGGRVESQLAVTPGQVLDVYVGGAGTAEPGAGGFNGGGSTEVEFGTPGGSGGGASDLRPSGGGLGDRLLVAGGGGGAGLDGQVAGGPGGDAGQSGQDGQAQEDSDETGATTRVTGGGGGGAGSQTAGGEPGTAGIASSDGRVRTFDGSPGAVGDLGQGGAANPSGSGAGGGGYYGGGSGGSGASATGFPIRLNAGHGGGGGGSSLDPDGGALADAPRGNGKVTITYTPADNSYDFTGFFAPVDNPPALNQMNAGRTVPVKFSLDGDKGLDILAAGSPTSRQINCATNVPVDAVETTTTSNSGLAYDSASQQYQYNWKTEKAWSGTCREFTLTLDDASTHTANFQFK